MARHFFLFLNINLFILIGGYQAFLKRVLPWGLSGKESACQAGDVGSIPGLGRSPGEENGNPL